MYLSDVDEGLTRVEGYTTVRSLVVMSGRTLGEKLFQLWSESVVLVACLHLPHVAGSCTCVI